MPAFNFQKQFVPLILSGEKSQTIRKRRKDGRDPNPGDTLYLYTGMRTKKCCKLRTVTCRQRDHIYIEGSKVVGNALKEPCVATNGVMLPFDRLHTLAVNDGFQTWVEMLFWFRDTHGLPFEGYIYHW